MGKLDWGQVTPESSNLITNSFTYIYNHDLSSSEKIDRAIRFIIGRLLHYEKHLPQNPNQIIKIDIRGQQISESTCNHIVSEIKKASENNNKVTIEIIK